MMGRKWIGVASLTLVAGCHGLKSDCHSPQEYQRARQVAPLKVPSGLDSPNTQSALVIPTVDVETPARGAKDACLDLPPRYKQAPTTKAASG